MQGVGRLSFDSVAHLGYILFRTSSKAKRPHRFVIAIRKSPDIAIDNIVYPSEKLIADDVVDSWLLVPNDIILCPQLKKSAG